MIISDWLKQAQKKLEEAGIATARLDCLVLLEDATKRNRSWLLAHPEHELQIETVQKLNKQIAQRARHTPLAYIRGKAEFYGREFIVNEHVLVPRPESESIIELLKTLPLKPGATIVDIGTGSGALAITAKLEIPESDVVAVDIDHSCLAVTTRNAEKLGADVQVLQGDLLAPLGEVNIQPTVLLCNLPYVPDNFPINDAAKHEPPLALFGGTDGLDLYRRLLEQITSMPTKPEFIITEAFPGQHQALNALAQTHGFRLQQTDELAQLYQA